MTILNKVFSFLSHEIIPSFLRLFIPHPSSHNASRKNWILEKNERQKLQSQGAENIGAEIRLHENTHSWERRQLSSQPCIVFVGHKWGWIHAMCTPSAVVGQHKASPLWPGPTHILTYVCRGDSSISVSSWSRGLVCLSTEQWHHGQCLQ